jgi:hypothetical protein
MSSFRFLVRMSSVQYIPSGSHCTDKEAQLGHNDKILSFFSAVQLSIRILQGKKWPS